MLPRPLVPLFAFIALLMLAGPPARADDASVTPLKVVAFKDVNVLPVDSERALRRQTVIVRGGRISALGPDLPIPAGARVIDGKGSAWLSPGLADMHTHAESPADMKLYLASGVTSVLHMGGASSDFIDQRRPLLNAAERPGPHVYAAFRVDGSPRYGQFVVKTPDEARWAVRLARTNGYDFIKVYNDLSPAAFEAIADEAPRQGMAVVGHGVTQVGLERQLAHGQVLVAHAEEFLYTVFSTRAPDARPETAPHAAEIAPVVAWVKRDKAYVTADLATFGAIARQWGHPEVVDAWLQAPQARLLSPDRRLAWRKEDYVRRGGSLDARFAFLRTFVKALGDAGVPLVAGTDAPSIPGLFPGSSLHDDLDALVAAGLTPYQALAAATRTPGQFIRATVPGAETFGVIAPGARADLVLTDANPLADLATLRRPVGVMTAGRWYDRPQLDALLASVAADYESVSLR